MSMPSALEESECEDFSVPSFLELKEMSESDEFDFDMLCERECLSNNPVGKNEMDSGHLCLTELYKAYSRKSDVDMSAVDPLKNQICSFKIDELQGFYSIKPQNSFLRHETIAEEEEFEDETACNEQQSAADHSHISHKAACSWLLNDSENIDRNDKAIVIESTAHHHQILCTSQLKGLDVEKERKRLMRGAGPNTFTNETRPKAPILDRDLKHRTPCNVNLKLGYRWSGRWFESAQTKSWTRSSFTSLKRSLSDIHTAKC